MYRLIIFVLFITPTLVCAQGIDMRTDRDTIRINDEITGKEEVFVYVDQMPEPTFNIYEYLSKNIIYPQAAIDSNIKGRVNIKFVVDTLGNITDVVALKTLHPLLDTEAIRVVKTMPNWRPGKIKGRAVKVYYTLPITFRLTNDEEK